MATTIDGQAIVQAILDYSQGVTRDRWHRYHFNGKRMPPTTKISGMLDKSRPLMKWASEMQQAGDIAASWDLVCEIDRSGKWPGEIGWCEEMKSRAPAHRKAQEELAKASEHGRQVHALIEARIRRRLGETVAEIDASVEAHMGFNEWLDWEHDSGFVPLMTEAFVISKKHGFCGQMDGVPALVGKSPVVWVTDWKTSNGIYTDHYAQNAGYRLAVREALKAAGIKAKVRGLLVRIPKDGKSIEVVRLEDDKANVRAEKAFAGLAAVYPWYEEMEKAGLEAWKARKAAEEA